MEEQQERRNVGERELEGGQPSRNNGQTGLEPEEHRINIVEISHRDWIESLRTAEESTQSQSQWPRIPKVPQMLRGTQDFKKFYEPRLISIGPYHHGKPDLHEGEMIKRLCAKKFLADSNQDIEALYTKIESNIEAVRTCYDNIQPNEYDDEALARMMLLDGCFLLEFVCGKDRKKVLRSHQINFAEPDLFLLENQLPFGVLKLIFEGANLEGPVKKEMKKFVIRTMELEEDEEDEEPSHLLALLRSALVGKSEPKQERQPDKKGKSSSSSGGDGRFCCPRKKGKQRGIRQSFRNIKELKAAGIHLRKSRTSFLRDISFNSYYFRGYLNLPPIIVDDSTKSRFLNIVAYEMCPDAPDDYRVTSYLRFLYGLIDHADDVKELRSKHILVNRLGRDEDVARIFNEIANDVVDTGVYGDVETSLQKDYDKRVNTWIAAINGLAQLLDIAFGGAIKRRHREDDMQGVFRVC
ncbi:UPF0481 protein At3g47200-like isoform X2 [Vitis riparia]|uniref:UPF0481 protein At3g47200-like isoform X2 n=1 Tax=Vitis riparia TaxID=96939 RepID=UPI00155AE9BA|nr:UPF0481 protein At3g47200-like isoform X2 [Vitis riparia]